MSLKEQLISYGHTQFLNMTETELQARREQTIAKTFMWMWISLLLSFIVAYTTALWILPLPVSPTLYWVSFLGWLGVVIAMNWKRKSMSYTTLATLLLVFAVLIGYGLSGIFWIYHLGSVFSIFLLTWGMFLALAFAWYSLKVDITNIRSVLFIALIMLIVASVANMFWWSAQFDLWISVIGVIVFSGFIVADMQMLKKAALTADKRIELLMALALFLNFINLFIFLLRLLGERN